MNELYRNVELLAPAGNEDDVYAAVFGGCDAIYLGGKTLSARASSENFTEEQIADVIDYCHLHGVKVYIAANTLVKNSELDKAFKFLSHVYAAGADAFITQDIGLALHLSRLFSDIEFHASTQMNIHTVAGAMQVSEMGFSRVVLSRETSLHEVKNISENAGIETEVFVHGSLCFSYSGHCLLSSMAGNRSGNRGRCAQPCRLKYELVHNKSVIAKGYLLSPKDIMTLEMLEEIVDAGVSSLKIEGRMKGSDYVYQVSKSYRKHLDSLVNIEGKQPNIDEDYDKLLQVYNRGGSFSGGYLKTHSGISMISDVNPKDSGALVGFVTSYDKAKKCAEIKAEKPLVAGDGIEIWTETEPHVGCGINMACAAGDIISLTIDGDIKEGNLVYRTFDKRLNDELKSSYKRGNVKGALPVSCIVRAVLGKPLAITLMLGEIIEFVEGEIVESASNAPLAPERLLEQVAKTGDYPFKLEFVDYDIDDNIYVQIKAINKLRRCAVEGFAKKLTESFKRKQVDVSYEPVKHNKYLGKKKLAVIVATPEQLEACLVPGVSRVYITVNGEFLSRVDHCIELVKSKGVELYIALSRIDSSNEVDSIADILECKDFDGYLVRTYGQLHSLKNTTKKKVLDSAFNIFNSLSVVEMLKYADELTLSQELTLKELDEIGGESCEVVIHGRQVEMVTRQCPIGLYAASKVEGKYCKLKNCLWEYALRDEVGKVFPLITDCDRCVASVLSSSVLCMLDKIKDIKKLPVERVRLGFFVEEPSEVEKIVKAYVAALNNEPFDYEILNCFETNYGHFYKSVL